jgi:hypothetical protein
MPTVEDGSVDVVFSGQNLEHLWIDDLTGFLREARRVLRPGGMLVVDSPNRIAVEALGWVQPEHTIELSASEATELLELAGFDVEIARGLWNCRDQRTGEWLPLQSPVGEVRSMLDRVAARRSIDDSFVWWLEARRSARPVDNGAVRDRVLQLFERQWNRRVNRAADCVGERGSDERWSVADGSCGRIYRTQGFPLFPGVFRVVATSPILTVNVVSSEGLVLASGNGCAEGTLSTAEFGVTAELVADEPLVETLDDVGVTVEMSK